MIDDRVEEVYLELVSMCDSGELSLDDDRIYGALIFLEAYTQNNMSFSEALEELFENSEAEVSFE